MRPINVFLLLLLIVEVQAFNIYPQSDIFKYYVVTRGIQYAQTGVVILFGIFIITIIMIILINIPKSNNNDNNLGVSC